MLLQDVFNRGLYLGLLFDDAARRHPYQAVILDYKGKTATEHTDHYDVTMTKISDSP